ncbi:putative nuclease HARBI1 [Prorops nasuta]|uniref:putative nuclease HARBI1 n=1 Tax=Prorops nasuta TaxID=863751 RepID=UPI0034CEC414
MFKRKTRIIRPRMNWFNIYNADDFRKRFRLHKEDALILLQKISHTLTFKTDWNHAISPMIQLLIALRFYSTGSFVIIISEFVGVSNASATKIVHRVSSAIAALSKEYIKFPLEPEDILRTQAGNFEKSGFIRVLGAIDCIHITIQSYGGEYAELFRNRKGFFSLNVQVIVNSKLQIMDIVARWPGSSHDSTIFNNSRIKHRFEVGEFGNSLLLGDSGYPNLPYLLTPLINPKSPAEILYNEAQIRTRSMVERCFGIWGRIFPVLTIGSRFRTPERTMNVIISCAVLYNIIRSNVEENITIDQYNNIVRNYNENLHADERRYLIESYFQSCL